MTVTPAEWLANSLLAVEDVLCNCAEFRTLMGAANVAAARALVYWQDTRSLPTAPYCLLVLGDGAESEQALRLVQHVDRVGCYLVWPRQQQVGDTAKDQATRELNSFGTLLKQVRDLVGTGTYLARARRSFETPKRTADNDADIANCWDASITFTWEI
ncbi:MAG: hypothetical protein RL030_2763 [Pseudomonadota bacterium]|jgi:hypothetical protein